MMFISTFIPTLLHLFLAIFAMLGNLFTKPHLHKLTEQIEKIKLEGNIRKNEELAKKLARYNFVKKIRLHLFVQSILVFCMFFLVCLLIIKKSNYIV